MGWKIFSIISIVVVLSTIIGPFAASHHSLLGLIGIGISIPASAGVLFYAFGKPKPSSLWHAFSWVFAAQSIGVITFFVVRTIQVAAGHSPVATATLLMLVTGYQYFTWLALYRLSGRGLPRHSSKSATRAERFAQFATEAATRHPRRTKIIAWCFVTIILAAVPVIVWDAISAGKPYKLMMPTIIGIVLGVRGYASAKKAREGK
jgi:hypothetical protein